MIVVTGATGNVGGSVVRQLVERGSGEVRAVSRHPDRRAVPAGVEAVAGDLADPGTYDRFLDGADRLFLFPVPETAGQLAAAAARAGVRSVVVLSSAAGDDEAIGRRHRAVEQAVEGAGLATTVLRPGAFAANALQWAPGIRVAGEVRTAYGDAAMAPIHEDDIAAVAVAALTEDGHTGRAYELTGPESLTFRDQVQAISRALGREVRLVELSEDEARQEMAHHMPAGVADTLLTLWRRSAGRPAPVLPTVEEVTGRPARPFSAWVADHLGAFEPATP